MEHDLSALPVRIDDDAIPGQPVLFGQSARDDEKPPHRVGLIVTNVV
jgi:hypothetical protein